MIYMHNSFQQPGYLPSARDQIQTRSRQTGSNFHASSRPPSSSRPRSIVQMNLCLICNVTFLAEKTGSSEAGLEIFLNLCTLLQVPAFQEFVPESNPLCSKCLGTIEEYIKLQEKIKELMDRLGEIRKMLGTQLVELYDATPSSTKNYAVKGKIYKIWYRKLHGAKSKAQSQERLTVPAAQNNPESGVAEHNSVVERNENVVTLAIPVGQDQDYTLLDISNNVSSNTSVCNFDAVSATGSIADHNDNDRSHLSMECPSPSPMDDDQGPSDHEKEEYIKNLNDNPSISGQSVSHVLLANSSIPTSAEVNESSTNETSTPGPSMEPQQWIDRRRIERPIVATLRRSHPCKFCGKLFPALFSLQLHERSHTGDKPFKCSICGRGFAAKAAMQKHELTHDKRRYEGEPQYECDLCGKKYHLERSLYTHKRDHMGIKRPKKRAPPKAGWKSHQCSICNKTFHGGNAKCNRDKHEKTHDKTRKEGEPKFSCDICGRRYHLELSLKGHLRRHALGQVRDRPPSEPKKRDPPGEFECKECPEGERPVYRYRKSLYRHKTDFHRGKTPPDRSRLRCIGAKSSDFKPRRKRSPKPPSVRPRSSLLFPKRKPGTPKEAICQYCGKDFKENYRLRQHILVHTGEKPLKCPFPECPKAFATKGNLDKHMKTHDSARFDGEPPHVCDFCGKGFYILGTLYHHRRMKHLGMEAKYKYRRKKQIDKPRECNICGKVVASLKGLSYHKALHGDPKFNCEVCGKPFHHKSDALDHGKKHEPTWMYKTYFRIKCSACPPERLPFQSKLLIRKHWAEEHKNERMPDEYKKPPKLRKPSKSSGKTKKLNLFGRRKNVGRTKRLNESEDEMSTSGSSSEADTEFENEASKTNDTEIQPVRRSERQKRGDMRSFSRLLKASNNNSEDDDDVERTKAKKFPTSTKRTKAKMPGSLASERTLKTETKLTDSYIKKILGGREMTLMLQRVAEDNISSETICSEKFIAISKTSRVNTQSSKIQMTKNVARRRGKLSGAQNKAEHSPMGAVASPQVIQPVPGETVEHNLEVVKEEPINNANTESELNDSYSDNSPPRPRASFAAKRPNFSSLIIHNPLSKNKLTNPIIISAVPATSSDIHDNNVEDSSAIPCNSENSGTDQNETVLGF